MARHSQSTGKKTIEEVFKDIKMKHSYEVCLKILRDKKIEYDRHIEAKSKLEKSMNSTYIINMISTMYDLLTTIGKIESLLNPVINGMFPNYKSGRYLDINSIQSSKDEKYIRINDSWGAKFIFPIDVFKYPDNVSKRNKIYKNHIDRCSLKYVSNEIQVLKNGVKGAKKHLNRVICELNNVLKLKKQLDNKKIKPLDVDKIEFDEIEDDSE